ncbi:MAG: polyprenol monophosphomannose synthase [Candidatus Cloacimonadota bacterium]|nr:MAG: polyprenol monophosphomannose synthase [Candidatus Cloacimonadota bacterium]
MRQLNGSKIIRVKFKVNKRALIIIPTYNEEENISKIITAVLKICPSCDVLIVDDNSPDGTGNIVNSIKKKEDRVHLIERKKKSGLGTAYVAGFKYGLKNRYDYIFEMDADFSHDPEDIPRFLDAIEKVDLVIGSRYKNGISVVNWPISRLLLSYFANVYARIVTGVPVMDLTAGFKCYRREVIESIDLDSIHSDGYGFQIEMNYWVFRKGYRIKEIPVIFVDRRVGESKMSKRIVWEAFFLVLRLRFFKIFGVKK